MKLSRVLMASFLIYLFLEQTVNATAGDISSFHSEIVYSVSTVVATPTDGGIRENVDGEFAGRFASWKSELLSTEFGSSLWKKYENKQNFVLTIRVTGKEKKGASTIDFLWNEDGFLVGATIELGGRLDKGFPDPIYYPVMSSIEEFSKRKEISGATVAATKFAHEFGHVDLTLRSNQDKVKLENQLMPQYNSIFLDNGFNTNDRRLLDLASRMGGTPIEIWENREYWGETTAMNFLLERTKDSAFRCDLIDRINENVSRFSNSYKDRFIEIYRSNSAFSCEK